jgi:ABC-2 type transport system permease protein
VLTGVFFSPPVSSEQLAIYPTYSETSMRGLWEFWGVLFLMLLAAVLTMRLFAEERKMGTLELLLTAPVRDSEVVLGKFLGSLGILTIMIALTFYYPILLMIFGDPDIGSIAATYIGLFLLGCTSLAVGIFTSSITSNQIVAAVVAGGILFAFWFLGMIADPTPGTVGELLSFLSLSTYITDFTRGLIDTRGIIYYLSITALFLFLAIRSLENSRWS